MKFLNFSLELQFVLFLLIELLIILNLLIQINFTTISIHTLQIRVVSIIVAGWCATNINCFRAYIIWVTLVLLMIANSVNAASYVGWTGPYVVHVLPLGLFEHKVVGCSDIIVSVSLNTLHSVVGIEAKLL